MPIAISPSIITPEQVEMPQGTGTEIFQSRKHINLRHHDLNSLLDVNFTDDEEIPEYKLHWGKLTDRLANINTSISTLLTAHEEQFLAAFTHQMHKLQQELTIMKINMDEKILQEKRNKKLMVLQQHLNYFRAQATRLESERNTFIETIRTLEKELDSAKRDRKYFECFLREERKVSEGRGVETIEKERWWRQVVEDLAKKKAGDMWLDFQNSKRETLSALDNHAPTSNLNSSRHPQ